MPGLFFSPKIWNSKITFLSETVNRVSNVLEAIKTLDVVFSSKLKINFFVAPLSCQVKITDWDFSWERRNLDSLVRYWGLEIVFDFPKENIQVVLDYKRAMSLSFVVQIWPFYNKVVFQNQNVKSIFICFCLSSSDKHKVFCCSYRVIVSWYCSLDKIGGYRFYYSDMTYSFFF